MKETITEIEMFRLISIRKGLDLEVKTGLQLKGNLVLKRAKETLRKYGYEPKRNKKDVLVQFNQLLSPIDELLQSNRREEGTNEALKTIEQTGGCED